MCAPVRKPRPPVAERLTFAWVEVGLELARRAVVVRDRGRATVYAVDVGIGFWLFAKLDGTGTVYQVDRDGCTCAGATCRRQAIRCRHQLAIAAGVSDGAL